MKTSKQEAKYSVKVLNGKRGNEMNMEYSWILFAPFLSITLLIADLLYTIYVVYVKAFRQNRIKNKA